MAHTATNPGVSQVTKVNRPAGSTGALTPIPGVPVTAGSAPVALTTGPTGNSRYVANNGDSTTLVILNGYWTVRATVPVAVRAPEVPVKVTV